MIDSKAECDLVQESYAISDRLMGAPV